MSTVLHQSEARPRARSVRAPARDGIASFPPPLPQNPYQRLLYEQTASHGLRLVDGVHLKLLSLWRARRRVRALHFHWPQNYWRQVTHPRGPVTWAKLALFGGRLVAARALGYRIAWTIHEVRPFTTESRWVDHLGGMILSRACHVLIANDSPTAADARRVYRLGVDTPRVVHHGAYTGVYPEGRSKAVVRAELGIPEDAFVALCFGHVARYKGIETTLAAFERLERSDAVLVVAGLVMTPEVGEAVRGAAERDPRVRALLEFVADERVAELYGAADVALCPRSDGGTSGALVLALSLGVPPIAADVPTYSDLMADGHAGWLFAPGDPGSMCEALEAAAGSPDDRAARAASALECAEELSWPRVGEQTARLFLGQQAA
jgi:glycosyltransferase involved in cell wall biosynthesis